MGYIQFYYFQMLMFKTLKTKEDILALDKERKRNYIWGGGQWWLHLFSPTSE